MLDDSTDETAEIVARAVAEYRAQGRATSSHLHRTDRTGYKAGALEAGLDAVARGEFLAIFDADFVPPPRLPAAHVPYFSRPEARHGPGALGPHQPRATRC